MFDALTERLSRTFQKLRGQSKLTEDNIQEALREIRISLLEADAALPVIQSVLSDIKEKALGQDVDPALNPAQVFIKLVHNELVALMGSTHAELSFKTQPPAVFLLAGLQGSGKTTTAAKLARHIKETLHKKILMISADTYRPAAIEQLRLLSQQVEVDFFEAGTENRPVHIAKAGLEYAKKHYYELVILDTAGRLHVDESMMSEIKDIHNAVQPIETLFVVDSMTGQDAANTAKAFHEALPLTGIILTKTDGDARAGAALSVKYITGQPIKYLGFGEKLDAIEPFHPERIASRMLGMGDILSLIEEVERKVDQKSREKLTKKLSKGKPFNLNDVKEQMEQLGRMGGMGSIMSKLGMSSMAAKMPDHLAEKQAQKTIAIINSMTKKERKFPKIIIGSRKIRIANGSGTSIQEVNRVLKQFEQMQKMMQKYAKPGAAKNLMRGMGLLKGMPGNFSAISDLLSKEQQK
ncbi:MAG: signal recognition particle protein [Legionellaceae bacterium]|nr:signal recognition particle protein [Legionellaceae bacterium]